MGVLDRGRPPPESVSVWRAAGTSPKLAQWIRPMPWWNVAAA